MENCFAANSDRVLANGVPRGRGRAPGALSHMVAANLRARALAPVVREIWAAGFMSYNAVSRELNRQNVPTLRAGKQWYPMTAGRLLVRLERAGLIRIRRPPSRGSRAHSREVAEILRPAASLTFANDFDAHFDGLGRAAPCWWFANA